MKKIICISLLLMGIFLTSCEKFFLPDANDVIREEDNFQKRSEIYSAFIGMAAVFQDVASQWLLLSELRGDMLEPSVTAPEEMWAIYRYENSEENMLIQPDVFYKVILYANDFIRHTMQRKQENSEILEENVYLGVLSQALCYRNWCYLTLGKLYGEAAWYDLSLSDAIDPAEIPVLSFKELIPELINSMKNGLGGIGGMHEVSWSDAILNNGDYSWNRVPVNAPALMTELYLWQGDYQQVVESAMGMIKSTTDVNKFKISSSYKNSQWATMISTGIGNAILERLTVIPFSYTENQTCSFQKWLLMNYLLPTSTVVERFEQQERTDGNAGDFYRGEGITYAKNSDAWSVRKYRIRSTSADAPVIIYRAADVHFMLIEGLNRLGYFEEALVLLNDGLKNFWDGSGFKPPFDNPLFSSSMRENVGIRGRVSLKPVRPEVFDDPQASFEQKSFALDSLMAEEIAMESAYEGKRWFTLMRLAEYWNRPEILADPVSEKFAGEREKYRALLRNPENWYIRVKHK